MPSLHLTLETEDGTMTTLEIADSTNVWITPAGQEDAVGSLYWCSEQGLTMGHWPEECEWVETDTLPAKTLIVAPQGTG